MNKRALTWNQFIDSGFDGKPYNFIDSEGVFNATVDMKRWGKRHNSMMVYFTLEDNRKIIAFAWASNNYLGLADIPVGALVTLNFERNSKGYLGLKSVD